MTDEELLRAISATAEAGRPELLVVLHELFARVMALEAKVHRQPYDAQAEGKQD